MLTPSLVEDRRMVLVRLMVLRVMAFVCFAALAVGFWIFQVVQHTKFQDLANHYLRTTPLRAPRGVLFDRNNVELVKNEYSFTIAIVREQSRTPRDLSDTIQRLAAATGVDHARLSSAVRRRLSDPTFRPIAVIEHATLSQVAAVTARKLELPEVIVQEVSTRHYLDGGLAAHLFGYVGEIQESQIGRPEYAGLQSGAIVGQAGLEKVYNAQLIGKDGRRMVAVNSQGREVQSLGEDNPIDGDRMQLTIDYDLQRALDEAFKLNGFAGAAVFMDPRNGEVLAMTSQPAYDPNDFANGMDRAKMTQLLNDPDKPFGDRLVSGTYQPGSTFKILMATAALAEGVITPATTFNCTGSIALYGQTFQCDNHDGHGTLDLRHAIEQSCNVYFYHVADLLSIDQIHAYAEKLGLVGKTGIDLPGEVDSLVPSTAWKLKTTGEKWYPGETISVGIGQGQVSVTPISLATMMATVANGGTVVTPHVVKSIDRGDGWVPTVSAPRSILPISPDILGPVRDGLWMVVNGDGTGSRARIAGHDVVGKTGTAQVISQEGAKAAAGRTTKNLADNSWFMFYASKDNPEISGVVFAEHQGHGALSSAPIARYVLETYYAKKEGRELPRLVMGADGEITIVTSTSPAAKKTEGTPAPSANRGGGGGQ